MGQGREAEVIMENVRAGVQRDYLQGLDNLRQIITAVELDVDHLKTDFFNSDGSVENSEESFEQFLKENNERLLYLNSKLRKNEVELEPVDGEMQLISFLNKVRDLPPEENVDQEVLDHVSEFWEVTKGALDKAKVVKGKFHTKVYQRLKTLCASFSNGETYDTALTKQYNVHVHKYEKDIKESLQNFDTLAKSFSNGLQQELFTDTSYVNRLLMNCDKKAFPILRLVPDLTEKLMQVCKWSKQWIDKDETYMHDISNYIREKRSQTRRKEEDLRREKKKQTVMVKSVEEAHDLFKSSKQKLAKIETELENLEEQMSTHTSTKKYKAEELKQKEGMVGFLEISIKQTKKNFSLQLKRSSLMRQLRDLEESLKMIEKELQIMEETIKKKSEAKVKMASTVEESGVSYENLKTDLDKFSENVHNLEKEVTELTDSLTSLEIIQSVKASPETIDDFYERPSTVKLAPSLKEKIMRKRKLKTVTSNSPSPRRS